MTDFRTRKDNKAVFIVKSRVPVWERVVQNQELESERKRMALLEKARKKEEREKRLAEKKMHYDISKGKVMEYIKSVYPEWVRLADVISTPFGLPRAHQNEPGEDFAVWTLVNDLADEGKISREERGNHEVWLRWVSDE